MLTALRSLLLGIQLMILSAQRRTTAIKVRCAGVALYKQEVACIISTVSMLITAIAALVTYREHVFRDSLAKPLVKDKILPDESILQILLLHGVGIVDDTAV